MTGREFKTERTAVMLPRARRRKLVVVHPSRLSKRRIRGRSARKTRSNAALNGPGRTPRRPRQRSPNASRPWIVLSRHRKGTLSAPARTSSKRRQPNATASMERSVRRGPGKLNRRSGINNRIQRGRIIIGLGVRNGRSRRPRRNRPSAKSRRNRQTGLNAPSARNRIGARSRLARRNNQRKEIKPRITSGRAKRKSPAKSPRRSPESGNSS